MKIETAKRPKVPKMPKRPFGSCPYGPSYAHEYEAAWESQREGVSDGVMFCSKCGDVRRMRPFVPLDDR